MKKIENQNCNLHVMPSSITDEDINALFLGIVDVVKKKFEIDSKKQIISMNSNLERVLFELSEKTKECNRLKNEIINLKSRLKEM